MSELEIPADCLEAVGFEADRLNRKTPWRVERDDLFQKGAAALVDHLHAGRPINQAIARVVARRRMVNYIRRLRRHEQMTPGEAIEKEAPRRSDPEAVLDVREALTHLSTKDRQVLAASLAGPPRDIAIALGLGLSGAKQRLTDARKRLRARLGDGYEHMSKRHRVKYSDHGRNGVPWSERVARRKRAAASDPPR